MYGADLEILRVTNPAINGILDGQDHIFATRRPVMKSEIAITQKKMDQVQEEISGLMAQRAALTQRVEIARQELDAVSPLAAKGLER
ncbi:hemolysin secretion protein D, partial [Bacillus sp. VT-16-64]